MWKIPALQKIWRSAKCLGVTVDFCSYGTMWRKRTHILFGNVPECRLAHFHGRLCYGRGVCSFSGKAHTELSGTHPTRRVPWTKVAEPYPKGLNRDLASALISDTAAQKTHN